MAMTKTYPGVHIEEVSSGVKPIESASTSTAAFIGRTGKTLPAATYASEPELIFTWADYVEKFGALVDGEKRGIRKLSSGVDEMGFAVYNFFMNGGGAAYIVHVHIPTSATNPPTESELYGAVFDSLEKLRDISIVCLPGKTFPENGGIIGLAVAHAEKMKNRMVLIDLDKEPKLKTATNVPSTLTTSEFAVAYYPWLEVPNPFYKPADPEAANNDAANLPPTLEIAPSGFMAGMWAKIDGRRGVWKAPAGVETALLGISGLVDEVEDARQGILNPLGINCIRKMPGFGPVVWGARTLATRANPEWRYIPIRRTANMIRESLYNNIQWAVFEPNDHRLWASLRVNIDAFMNGLWRAGAFQGEKASDAYFVRCNLGDTMTQDDIDTGKVIVEVGFAPLKPAEFVIVRIQQKVAQQ